MKRSDAPELMDDLTADGPVVDQTLRELDFINKWLGGNQLSSQALLKLWPEDEHETELTLLDLGCGSGDIIRRMQDRIIKLGGRLMATGLDANPHIVALADGYAGKRDDIDFITGNVLDPGLWNLKIDIVHASLFLHHFTEEELIFILGNARKSARIGLIINDLHRHPLAYYSIKILTRLFSRSEWVRYDAPLSVQRGFTRSELKKVLEAAGWTDFNIRWGWAFRWQVIAWK